MVDFKALLNKRVDAVEKPKPLPVGLYICGITKYEAGESQQKKTPFIRYIFRVMASGPDVDVGSLPADWQGRELRGEFYLTEGAMWRFREFIENGLGIEVGARTFDEVLPETNNKMVGVQLIQEPSTKPGDDSIYNRIAGYVKVDA